jgi:HAD superfamily hydrolase (TIGR01450 family)
LSLIKDAEAWFIDLDGTLYLGEGQIIGAADFIGALREKAPFYLYSNNSSRDKSQYVEKLKAHDINVHESDIILSTDGMIFALKEKEVSSVFVLGTVALSERLLREGFIADDTDPDCVVVGYDTELTYKKLQTAAELINKGVPYYASHPDVVCPTSKGPIPDIGSIVAMLETTTGIAPKEVFGKPKKTMVEHVMQKKGWTPEKIVFIGDRIYTDQVMAKNIGAKFVLVLSGETKREDVEFGDTPDMIVSSVATLTPYLKGSR